MKTYKLSGKALDWAVARAIYNDRGLADWDKQYSSNWAHGGPLIEMEGISIVKDKIGWFATTDDLSDVEHARYSATTPLVAAMRFFVGNNLGDDVEVPQELTPNGEVRGASVTAQPACEASSREAATSTVVLGNGG